MPLTDKNGDELTLGAQVVLSVLAAAARNEDGSIDVTIEQPPERQLRSGMEASSEPRTALRFTVHESEATAGQVSALPMTVVELHPEFGTVGLERGLHTGQWLRIGAYAHELELVGGTAPPEIEPPA